MFFLAIDGGGTKTECAVGDRNGVLSRTIAGSCKIREAGHDAATANLRDCVGQALKRAHVRGDEIAASVAGIAGASDPAIVDWIQQTLGHLVGGKIAVVGDHLIAFEAAFPSPDPGVIVVAGTGSIAYGRNTRGKTARVGGHGPETSDEGSGRWIGKLALDSGLLVDGAEAAADPATLFPAVLKLAEVGNAEANDLLERAGQELAKLVGDVARELRFKSPRVRTAGGVLQNATAVQNGLREALAHHCPGAVLDLATVTPIAGALALARQLRTASVAH